MARRRRNITVAVSPLMAWLQRFAVFLLILIALSVSWLIRANRESRAAQIENNI